LARNPAWTRDELILALELYFRVNPLHTSEQNPEIKALSAALNELPVHAVRPDGEHFRNPNGVYMKLCNFLRFDPGYEGSGLTRGNRLEEEVWNEFADDPELLAATAAAILASKGSVSAAQVDAEVPSGEEEFPEGRLLTAVHKRRERNTAAVRRKKASVLAATGRLECEVCGFDFESVYGELGHGFAECHHTVPLSELDSAGSTRLSDLAVVCANCHRMIHRSRPVMTVGETNQIVTARRQNQRLDWQAS
jgi:5-methylcytosine-specific restriction protein A